MKGGGRGLPSAGALRRRFCGNALFDLGFRKKDLDYLKKDLSLK
jgi:hypothetical protein